MLSFGLAKEKGLDISKLEQYKDFEIDFYPERNNEKSRPFEIRNMHISNLLKLEDFDLSKYTRIQVDPCPNFFSLDMILENGIPVSVISNECPLDMNQIEHDDEYFNIIRQDFDIKDEKATIYNIETDTYMIIKADGSSVICSKSSKTGKIYYPLQHEIDLDIASHDIEEMHILQERYNQMQKNSEATSLDTNDTAETSVDLINVESKKGNMLYLFDNFKNFFKNIFKKKNLSLPEPNTNLPDTETKDRHLNFISQLNPDNENYKHITIAPVEEKSEHSTKNSIDTEQEIE